MKSQKKYILSRFNKMEQEFKTKEEAIKFKDFLEENFKDSVKDIKIYEEKTEYKELK